MNATAPSQTIYPILPLRDIVVFPSMIVPLFVGRERSVKALEEVVKHNRKILLIAQKDAGHDDPRASDIYRVGTLASILQLLKLPDGTVKVLVEGEKRARVVEMVENPNFLEAQAEVLHDEVANPQEAEALARALVGQFEQYIKLNKKIPPEILGSLGQITDISRLSDTVASHMTLKISDKQEILEVIEVGERLERVYGQMEGEISVLNTEKRIRSRVKRQMEKTQREYYLNEQMKAIQRELGESEDGKNEIGELEERIKNTKLSKEAKEKVDAEVKKLKNMSPMSAEATVVRNYLDWVLGLPWKKFSKTKKDIAFAEKVLNKDHYGLKKVKERILEHLAVQLRTKQMKGPILCLVGPPGVGKTSLARSIAEATGRKYVRVSLGGVRDEAEIRGHRRTYIGSMPGKIIQSMKKAGTSNPLFLLDEIDKMGHDFRGDPASALLEVLDPEQNVNFSDHYLEVDYDLSSVMFITTANSMNMPRPLLDRMEIIRLSGYTEDEKVAIAREHLIDKEMKDHGLKKNELAISDAALRDLIRYYTKEAGVRNLEREIANICRKSVKEILRKKSERRITVTPKNLEKFAGVKKYMYGLAEKESRVGVTTGLAYTDFGGDLLQIEAVTIPGKGRMTITGRLGEVMQESIQAASSYVRSRCLDFGIIPPDYQNKDIHVHVPEGAGPKDGPSAGAAMVTTIVSVLSGVPVKKTVAMTGEISLRGNVMAIGGLKEKLLAALRGGIETVIIPEENVKDLKEIPDNVKRGLEIIPVSTVDEVLKIALTEPLTPREWTPPATPVASVDDDASEDRITH
ncbi:MAG: endopeptidase La [Alphaproteobacteria bacterium]|nr:endopeptidase La [Alphaproteobacteria bacterium]